MVEHLAGFHPAAIYFSGRNQSKADEILTGIRIRHADTRITFIKMDHTSLDTVHRAMEDCVPSMNGRLDLLICNAGIMATPPGLSTDGYEIQWATNHLGHALIIKHLLPVLRSTAKTQGDARIVSVTSSGISLAPADVGIVFDDLKTTQETLGFISHWKRYGQSKLANILYTSELVHRFPSLSGLSVHPGISATDLVHRLRWPDRLLVYATCRVVTPDQGCENSLWAATVDRDVFENGGYYFPVGEPPVSSKWVVDAKLAAQLWEWTGDALQDYNISS